MSGNQPHEVNPPAVITVVEIHQDAAHDGIVGLEAGQEGRLVVDGVWATIPCGLRKNGTAKP
jgi:hypothetical protein